MDPQIEELKQLVRQNTALTQETNEIVKSMRNASRWGRAAKLAWVGLIVATSVISFILLSPYLQQIGQLYQSIQEALEEARQIGQKLQGGEQPAPESVE